MQPQADITEADLSGHLKNAKGGAEVKASDRGKRKNELHERDSQLYEAVNILRGLHLFQKAQQAKAEKELEKAKRLNKPLPKPQKHHRAAYGAALSQQT